MSRFLEPFKTIEGEEEPLFGALKRIKRSIEEQGRANFNSFVAVDYFLYNGMEKGVGKEIVVLGDDIKEINVMFF